MKNVKHTPGPWMVHPDMPDTVCTDLHEDEDKPEFYNWNPIAEGLTKADARLIAAAPELLEALDGVMQILRNYQGDMPNCIEADLYGPLKDAYAAIAKATGGAE